MKAAIVCSSLLATAFGFAGCGNTSSFKQVSAIGPNVVGTIGHSELAIQSVVAETNPGFPNAGYGTSIALLTAAGACSEATAHPNVAFSNSKALVLVLLTGGPLTAQTYDVVSPEVIALSDAGGLTGATAFYSATDSACSTVASASAQAASGYVTITGVTSTEIVGNFDLTFVDDDLVDASAAAVAADTSDASDDEDGGDAGDAGDAGEAGADNHVTGWFYAPVCPALTPTFTITSASSGDGGADGGDAGASSTDAGASSTDASVSSADAGLLCE
jgi:hypothetical protein